MANTLLGNGVCRYIVPFITSGDPSCPRSTPVENIHATCILPTFFALICVRLLYRWLYMSPACIAQLSGLAIIFSRSAFAHVMAGNASSHAIASTVWNHRLSTIFIWPSMGDRRVRRAGKRCADIAWMVRITSCERSVSPRSGKVNLSRTICVEPLHAGLAALQHDAVRRGRVIIATVASSPAGALARFACLVLALASASAHASPFMHPPAAVAVAPGVFVLMGRDGDVSPDNLGRIANIAFVVGPRGVVVV